MADKQHTQTHPKFTWLFLATPKSHPDCSPVVLRFDTDTEECPRSFPGLGNGIRRQNSGRSTMPGRVL